MKRPAKKHTPSPWEVVALVKSKSKPGELGDFLIRAKNAPGGIAVTVGGLGAEEKKNASLIAAAPNLLATLEFLKRDLESGNFGERGALALINATIAFAKKVKKP